MKSLSPGGEQWRCRYARVIDSGSQKLQRESEKPAFSHLNSSSTIAVTKFCPRMRDMSQDFTGIPGTEKQTRTERSYGCPGPPGWSKFTGPYPLDLISTVLAAWHQKSLLQVCRDLEKSRSQSMAVSDVGQLERWVQVCPPHAPHTAPLTCADLL